jgi:hypothetical protein
MSAPFTYLCSPELTGYEANCPLPWEKQPFMIRVKMIQQVEQLSPALQKCDNSWVAEHIVMHKIKNKHDNIIKKLPDKATGPQSHSGTLAQGRPRPSASSSFNSTSSTVPIDDNDGNNLKGSQ